MDADERPAAHPPQLTPPTPPSCELCREVASFRYSEVHPEPRLRHFCDQHGREFLAALPDGPAPPVV